jgi:hypothetical protein
LFVTDGNDDRDGHGPAFFCHMRRINSKERSNITVFHSFRDEVDVHRKHVWKCTGLCKFHSPYFGIVKRAMNRPPQPADRWWKDHERKWFVLLCPFRCNMLPFKIFYVES